MSRETAYDLFVSKELDPVSFLESAGINESNKFNPAKLACVLASFGDFKDKKYRLKIRREQSVMIQAVRYLLEKSATEHKLGKRKSSESVESAVAKRRNSRGKCTTEPSSKSSEMNITGENKSAIYISLGLEQQGTFLVDEDVEAALILRDLAMKFSNGVELLSTGSSFKARITNSAVIPENKASIARDGPVCHARSKEDKDQLSSKTTQRITADWYRDKELHGSRLKSMLVTIHAMGLPADEKHYAAYEGKYARMVFMLKTPNDVLARIKLFRPTGNCKLLPCREAEFEEGGEMRIPARFLLPVLPEKYGDQVVVLRDQHTGIEANVKGIRGRVHAILHGQPGAGVSDGEMNLDLDVVDVESEMGRLRLPRVCLAKCAY